MVNFLLEFLGGYFFTFLIVSEKVTAGIRVKVTPCYLPERSNPIQPLYFFAYQVFISNESKHTVQLLSRYWRIRDAFGRIEEVEGPGVVGKQPYLAPKESFEYTSFCPLPTEFGVMEGAYVMQSEDGEEIRVRIAPFQLVAPQAVN